MKYGLLQGFLIVLLIFCPTCLLAADQLHIEVEGVEGDVLDNVKLALAVPPGMVRGGKIDDLWLKLFAKEATDKVAAALQPFAYYNAKIHISLETPAKGVYRLDVKIDPGEPVRVTSATVDVRGAGTNEQSLNELARDFPLKAGDVLKQVKYEDAKSALKSKAVEIGYLDADFTTHEILISKEKNSAIIRLVLDTGPQYFFGKTSLTENTGYPERFLRRYIAFKPGDVFTEAKIVETQYNFINSERFRQVIVIPEKQKSTDHQIPVFVRLKPAPRRRVRVGAGYGTDTGARFTGSYRDLNVFHRGHSLLAELYVAQRLQGVAVGYSIPSGRDIKSATGLQLNLQHEDTVTYNTRLIAAEVNRSRSFGPGILGTVYLRFLQEDYTIGGESSNSRLIMPGIRFSVSRYDNLTRPTKGYRYALEARGTDQYLGSSTGFIQLLADTNALIPLPWRLSLFMRGNVGVTAQNEGLSALPPSIRFFAGGDNSVRGYAYQSLGPRDSSGQVVGGKNLLVASVELQRALFKNWAVSAFFDTGNAFDSFSDIRLYSGAGIGVHYYTIVGALNLYIARQVGVPDPANRIIFTVGFEL
jgi:translocation and assembly module TamA